MSTRLNFIIFGATGYTGKIVVNEMALAAKLYKFSWGVAGRSVTKLREVLNSVSASNNIQLDEIQTISADITNPKSVNEMCNKAAILINCVGPYRYYGEEVVRQCLITNTHHLDFTGEPEFMEKIQLKYNDEAFKKNIFIISGCGFDSVIADMGVLFTRNSSPYELCFIESYLTLKTAGKYSFNYATWESAIEGFSSVKNLKHIRKSLFTPGMPKPAFRAPESILDRTNLLGFFYDRLLQKYCFMFFGSDKSVVERTQLFNYRHNKQKPLNYIPYMTVNSLYGSIFLVVYGFMFTIMVRFKFGRYLLLKYYVFFSNGMVSKSDFKIENSNDVTFRMELRGYGLDKDKNIKKLIVAEVNGPEPSYLTASRIIVNCALILLNERDRLPVKGGVLTPGAAFINTSFIEKMKKHEVHFEVIHSESIKKSNL